MISMTSCIVPRQALACTVVVKATTSVHVPLIQRTVPRECPCRVVKDAEKDPEVPKAQAADLKDQLPSECIHSKKTRTLSGRGMKQNFIPRSLNIFRRLI